MRSPGEYRHKIRRLHSPQRECGLQPVCVEGESGETLRKNQSMLARARGTLDGRPEVKQIIATHVFFCFWLTRSSQATPFAAYETRLSLSGVPPIVYSVSHVLDK